MAKRISAIFFLTVIFSAFAVLCVRFSAGGADGLTLTLRALVDGEVSAQLEEAACENMPGHSMLHKLAVDARLFGGSAEIDGILVGDTMLMKNVHRRMMRSLPRTSSRSSTLPLSRSIPPM